MTYLTQGHVVQGFGQTAPVGLAAEQPVHDDDRRLVPGVGHRLVQRVRHVHGPGAVGGGRRAAVLADDRGGRPAAQQRRRPGLDHGVDGRLVAGRETLGRRRRGRSTSTTPGHPVRHCAGKGWSAAAAVDASVCGGRSG